MKTPLYFHEDYGNYSFGRFHPFDATRFSKYVERVKDIDEMISNIKIFESPLATDEELELVHSKEYIEKVYKMEEVDGNLTPDTPVKKKSPDAGRRIVGGSLEAARHIDDDTIINLGGLHHSGRDYGEGFCIFNDVAIAAQHLLDEERKVCVFDTDAHQGNGTMDVFYDESNLLFVSTHQDPSTLYPGEGYIDQIGREAGKGYSVNIPMPRDSTISDYHYAIEEVAKPVVDQFSPDVVIRNGGSDPLQSDTLTDLALDLRGMEYLGKTAREMAEESGAGHIDLMLSGYGPQVVEGWLWMTKGALDLNVDLQIDRKLGEIGKEPKKDLEKDMEELQDILSSYWDF